MTRKDRDLFERNEPISIDWEQIIFSIIVVALVTFFLWLGCSIASSGASKYGPRAGVNKHLMKHFDAADRINAEKHRKQKARREAKRKKKKAYENKLKDIFGYVPSKDEIILAKRVCMAEGGNTESVDGLIAILSVIRNRVLDKRFPNTIYEVCTQKYQFETVTTGAIWRYEVNDKVEEAWDSLLDGAYLDYPDICFFTAGGYNAYCKPAYKLGNHYFGY